MNPNHFAEALLFWSVITFIVAITILIASKLLLREKKEEPKLICITHFSFGFSADEIEHRHKIIVKSISNELLTIAFVRYYLKPRGFWRKLFKKKTWESKRWIHDDKPGEILDLEEGEQAEIMIDLPVWVDFSDVLKVEVYDHSGRASEVKWPSPKKIAFLTHHEILYETEERNEDLMCKVIGYFASGEYHIYTYWNLASKKKKSYKGIIFHFKGKNKYEMKLQDIIENQRPKLLTKEIGQIT